MSTFHHIGSAASYHFCSPSKPPYCRFASCSSTYCHTTISAFDALPSAHEEISATQPSNPRHPTSSQPQPRHKQPPICLALFSFRRPFSDVACACIELCVSVYLCICLRAPLSLSVVRNISVIHSSACVQSRRHRVFSASTGTGFIK
ncbi:hypothetical protein C8Q70DRAFT_59362 [Cubamyces menziesii]|nr:hypothetical protein C8Q70DRAFT_59362 [Cubamyces menziesii]